MAGSRAGRAPLRQRGVALLLTLVVMATMTLGGLVALEMRLSNLRQSGESLRGKQAFYCAEAGLAAGKTFFRAHPAQWNSYLRSGYTFTGRASPVTGGRYNYAVQIFDNVDEMPPLPSDPLTDVDQLVLMKSTCTDSTLNTPVTLQQYLTMIPPTGTQKAAPARAPTVYQYTDPQTPGGPSFTGADPVDASGGVPAAMAGYSLAGIWTVGLDVRNNQLQLESTPTTFPFIWLSNSGDGTISKLSTDSGAELGRYATGPGFGNPSRLAVDMDGNVWVGNRANNTLTKIGLEEAGNCVDRNGDGVITTSTGADNVLPFTGSWGGGVAGATDECILLHIGLTWPGISTPTDIRLVAVDANNNIFSGGIGVTGLYKFRSKDGVILAATESQGHHYGGFVDKTGVVWISSDNSYYIQKVSNDLSSITKLPIQVQGYGIGMDLNGRIWSSEWSGGHFQRMDPDGTHIQVFRQSVGQAQGLALAPNGDVFVTGSLNNPVVDHFDNNGRLIETITVGGGVTGVAFDHAGRLWSSNYSTGTATQIDLVTKNTTTFPVGNGPYNYSDMTGYVSRNVTSLQGNWSVRLDCGTTCSFWQSVAWSATALPAGTAIHVRARAGANLLALATAPWLSVVNGQAIPASGSGLPGRIIEVQLQMTTMTNGVTPVVRSITLTPW